MNILIVEDENDLGAIVLDYLAAEKFACTLVDNADSARTLIETEKWELVLLDIMLPSSTPNFDGLALCELIRSTSNTPVILMTAKVEEADRLKGFEIGAYDYICKPFSPRELVARVKAVLKRTHPNDMNPSEFLMTKENLTVAFGGKSVELTLIEYRLLKILREKIGQIVSREELMKNAYHDHRIVSDRTMDSHITKLRKRLTQLTDAELILSVYGAGYKFQLPE